MSTRPGCKIRSSTLKRSHRPTSNRWVFVCIVDATFLRQTELARRWSPSSATTWPRERRRHRSDRRTPAQLVRPRKGRPPIALAHGRRRRRCRSLPRTGAAEIRPLCSSRAGGGLDPEHLVVKTRGNPRALIPTVATILSNVDPQLGATEVTTMDDVVGRVRAPWRFNMLLFSVFSGLSIGLTIIGIAGLIVSTVNWRRREIGVRLALGAAGARRRVTDRDSRGEADWYRGRTGCAVVVARLSATLEPVIRCRSHRFPNTDNGGRRRARCRCARVLSTGTPCCDAESLPHLPRGMMGWTA